MSEIRALEELRELSEVRMDGWLRMDTRKIADAIESEIAERFIELPVGAESAPIHVGDTVYNALNPEGVTVYEIGFTDNDGTRIYDADGNWALAGACTHAKPRTLEDALTDLAYLDPVHRYPDEFFGPIIAKYADEIRELLGGTLVDLDGEVIG